MIGRVQETDFWGKLTFKKGIEEKASESKAIKKQPNG